MGLVDVDAVNRNYPEEEFDESQMSRKIDADIYIDDRNVEFAGQIDWSEICKKLKVGTMADQTYETEKKSFIGKLFGR